MCGVGVEVICPRRVRGRGQLLINANTSGAIAIEIAPEIDFSVDQIGFRECFCGLEEPISVEGVGLNG